jgi:hypothetical protein
MRLVNRLGGAHAVQLNRAIRAHNNKRDARQICLGDCSMNLSGRSATRHHHDNRQSAGKSQADRKKCTRSLVKAYVDGDPVIAKERERKQA